MKPLQFTTTGMGRFWAGKALFLLGLMLASAAHAQSPVTQRNPVTIYNSEQFELASTEVGDTFNIMVALPASYATGKQSYNVLYVLDADLMFGMVTNQLRGLSMLPDYPEFLIVGIGYPDPKMAGVLRSRDLTPEGAVPAATVARNQERYQQPMAGGADNFLRFFEKELAPLIKDRYRTDGKPAAIFGDSYGGLFTYYAFLQGSPVFDRYWMGSPGLLREGQSYLDGLPEVLQTRQFQDVRIYVSIGEVEITHPYYGQLGTSFQRMVTAFNVHPADGLSIGSHIFPGQDHLSVAPAAMMEAMRFLLRNPGE